LDFRFWIEEQEPAEAGWIIQNPKSKIQNGKTEQ